MGYQPQAAGDLKYGVSYYDNNFCQMEHYVPRRARYRAFFGNRYDVPTDIDAVWAEREVQQNEAIRSAPAK